MQRGLKSVIFWALAISLLIHGLTLVKLGYFSEKRVKLRQAKIRSQSKKPVRVRITQKTPKKIKKDPKEAKKILETPLQKTEPPDNPSRLGAQDHKTKKETKVVRKRKKPKGLDAAQASPFKKSKIIGKGNGIPKPPAQKSISNPFKRRVTKFAKEGKVAIKKSSFAKKRNVYESLLPKANELGGQIRKGYQDFITDDLAVADKIDMNTSEFRFIGYFSSMRKSIELVWGYPSDAVRRHLQGIVELEFHVNKDGSTKKIRVVQSSGHKVLDKNIVSAIKTAQPFAPLPKSYNKKKLVVTASFHYVLSGLPVAH